MNIIIQPQAEISILSVSEYIDGINTFGSGERWIKNLISFCEKYAISNIKYSLCNNIDLAKQNYSCIVFNNWIIAFTLVDNNFIIHQLIYGSLLK